MTVVKELKARSTLLNKASVVGVLMGSTDNDIPLVSFAGSRGLSRAKSALSEADCLEINAFPVNVLIVFENGDESKPVVAALVRSKLFPLSKQSDTSLQNSKNNLTATIDGRAISLSATDEIRLKCGKSSILLRKDGKIVIKGANLISRSSGSNKIKGGSVGIN